MGTCQSDLAANLFESLFWSLCVVGLFILGCCFYYNIIAVVAFSLLLSVYRTIRIASLSLKGRLS